VLTRFISGFSDLREILRFVSEPGAAVFRHHRICVRMIHADLDPSQYGEDDRREVDPPVEVEAATWSPGGTLDWWVKERQQWLGRVRGLDGRQRVDQSG
jgi:hypothetical protein